MWDLVHSLRRTPNGRSCTGFQATSAALPSEKHRAANKEIALALNIAERTVKAHLTHIFGKLGVSSRAEAVAYAIRAGLIPAKK